LVWEGLKPRTFYKKKGRSLREVSRWGNLWWSFFRGKSDNSRIWKNIGGGREVLDLRA